jgi:pyrroline-5-carboxylate reductase
MSYIETTQQSKKILFIGCGNMGKAFLKGIISEKLFDPSDIYVIDKNFDSLKSVNTDFGIIAQENVNDKIVEAFKKSDLNFIFLAVKPTHLSSAAESVQRILDKTDNLLIMSCLAGVKVSAIEKVIGGNFSRIVRCMPNLAVQVKEGVTVFYKHKNHYDNQNTLSEKVYAETVSRIFESTGVSFEVQDESLLNAITALSGSGTGYVAYFMEHMLKAAEEFGFSYEEALVLIAGTFKGAAALWLSDPAVTPAELRRRVTSPQGTTEAAITLLEASSVGTLFQKALRKAFERAEELSERTAL